MPVHLPDAESLLTGWLGRTLSTVTGSPNKVLGLERDAVLVGTRRSSEGEPVPLVEVQRAIDLFAEQGGVDVSPATLGYRSAFGGAVLRTLPGAVVRTEGRARVELHATRPLAVPSPQDQGRIRPWWRGDPAERMWVEITDRPDIGTDLHCPQRDTAGRANPGYSTILFAEAGDVVVHYDRRAQAITSWSIVRGSLESAPTLWASHRGAVRRRVGTERREQPGWWRDLEGPFLVEPIPLATLRARAPEILAAIAAVTPSGQPSYAPFYGYGAADELRPTQYYLTKLPLSVAAHLPGLIVAQGTVQTSLPGGDAGVRWRRPWVSESDDRSRLVEVDVEIVERGLRGHVSTEIALAEALEDLGITPLSPGVGDPNFDVAWRQDGVLYVAEVKSITERNEERQLRLGLGQVLRYRALLAAKEDGDVRAVLVPERAPRDPTWWDTCAASGVRLLAGAASRDELVLMLSSKGPTATA
ncbi:MAG: hypothetical protein AB7O78_02615 [Thermoleophilia bacterium]